MKKFYHASPVKLRSGTVLNACGRYQGPQAEVGRDNRMVGVYMTDQVRPHHTIAFRAYTEQWYVYEVRPCGRTWFSRDYGEWCADSAIVVSCVKRLTPVAEKLGHKVPSSGGVSQRSRWAFMPPEKRPLE